MTRTREQSQGFGGQSLIVELRDERQVLGRDSGAVKDSERAGGPELNAILARGLDGGFTYLKDLDEYGTTIFNRLQLEQVLLELQRLRAAVETESEEHVLERVIELAERCRAGQPHCVLAFLGD